MKTKLLVFTLTIVSVAACAQSSEFEGFHAGVGLEYVQPKVTFTDNYPNHIKWDKNDLVALINISYHKAINSNWLIGGGLTYDLGKTNAGTKNGPYGPVKTTLKNHNSIYIEPSYMINSSSALFVNIGYHSMKVNAIGEPSASWSDDKFNAHGVGYGLGYKQRICNHIYGQTEILVVDYKNKYGNRNSYLWNYKQKMTSCIFTLGYKF